MTRIDTTHWHQMSPLLDELLDADREQRAARIAQIRDHDARLADMVDTLLGQEAALDASAFLEGSVLGFLDLFAVRAPSRRER